MRIVFFSCPQHLFAYKISNDCLDLIAQVFALRGDKGEIICEPKTYVSFEFNRSPEVDRFEALYRARCIVFLVDKNLDRNQQTDLKMADALAHQHLKEIYLILPGLRVVRAEIIGEKLQPGEEVARQIPILKG